MGEAFADRGVVGDFDVRRGARELLECACCGLKENVLISGQLITYRGEDVEKDTGLRFKNIGKGRFRCPSCQATVKEPAA